jgi:hypothetical protein
LSVEEDMSPRLRFGLCSPDGDEPHPYDIVTSSIHCTIKRLENEMGPTSSRSTQSE